MRVKISRSAAWLALATGCVTILGLIFIALFFMIGQPWGSLNDAFIALEALLSAVLALRLYLDFHSRPYQWNLPGLIFAGVGALVVTVGSALVISGTTGYVLAGHYMNFGFSLIGLWLLIFNSLVRQMGEWPRSFAIFGLITVVVMVVGLGDGYGILRGLDTNDLAPWFVNMIGYAGVIGWGILYPIWSIWFSRLILTSL